MQLLFLTVILEKVNSNAASYATHVLRMHLLDGLALQTAVKVEWSSSGGGHDSWRRVALALRRLPDASRLRPKLAAALRRSPKRGLIIEGFTAPLSVSVKQNRRLQSAWINLQHWDVMYCPSNNKVRGWILGEHKL